VPCLRLIVAAVPTRPALRVAALMARSGSRECALFQLQSCNAI
jgi:hypothetical protein